MSTEGPGSAREEAERLVATGLGAVATALQGIEARRQLRLFAEEVFGSDRIRDLSAGLGGFAAADGTPWAAADGAAGAAEGAAAGPGGEPAGDAAPDGAGVRSGSAGFSTGSADCCVCPVCRVIAALRDPSPELAERLASAAGDVAVGVAGVLRAFSAVAHPGGAGAGQPGGEQPGPERSGTDAPVPPPRSRPPDSEILVTPTSNAMSDSPRSSGTGGGTATARDTGRAGPPKPMAKKVAKKAVRRMSEESGGPCH